MDPISTKTLKRLANLSREFDDLYIGNNVLYGVGGGHIHISGDSFCATFTAYTIKSRPDECYPAELHTEFNGVTFMALLTREKYEALHPPINDVSIVGHVGHWHSVDSRRMKKNGADEEIFVYLMEHDDYGDEAPFVAVDIQFNSLEEDISNGLDEMLERGWENA